jgi:hypothetical protein
MCRTAKDRLAAARICFVRHGLAPSFTHTMTCAAIAVDGSIADFGAAGPLRCDPSLMCVPIGLEALDPLLAPLHALPYIPERGALRVSTLGRTLVSLPCATIGIYDFAYRCYPLQMTLNEQLDRADNVRYWKRSHHFRGLGLFARSPAFLGRETDETFSRLRW